MIASFSSNFVFVKTRKTGGTSVEIVLSTWLSAGDICTPISKADEEIRRQFATVAPQREYQGAPIFNHMPAREIRRIFPDLWASGFTFAIERHPYEKAVSLAFHSAAVRGEDFETALDRVVGTGDYIDREIYRIDGEIAVDEVIPYDRLWPRLGEIAERLGQRLPDEIPRAKGAFRQDRRPARDILSDRHRARIQEDAHPEFEAFGFAH
jgi:hypothetical protein